MLGSMEGRILESNQIPATAVFDKGSDKEVVSRGSGAALLPYSPVY